MKDKLSPKRVACTLGIVSFIVSVVCLVLIVIAPTAVTALFGSIFHGIDVTQIAAPVSWGSAILGVIVAALLGLLIGWLFVVIYNKLN